MTESREEVEMTIQGTNNNMDQRERLLDSSNQGKAKFRVIVVTVCLSPKITNDTSAFMEIIEQLKQLQTYTLKPNDIVLFNIGGNNFS